MAGLFDRLKRAFVKPRPKPPTAIDELRGELGRAHQRIHELRAKIDAAQTTDENRKHWSNADFLSADAAYDAGTRFALRNRARYETVNNCYAKGAIRSGADDKIGTGPRLQLEIPDNADGSDNDEGAAIVEWNYGQWCDATLLPIKLRLAEKSVDRDGECFGIFDTDPNLDNPVKFDIRWLETDQCSDPFRASTDPFITDGIRFDRMGKPIEYSFLRFHPGNIQIGILLQPQQVEKINADRVMHLFDPDRIGQHRGIPALTPALPIYSQTRRLTLATLTAAEFAAMIAGVMKTTLPPGEKMLKMEQMELIDMVRGALLTLPDQWDAKQMESKQPNAEYGAFKRELLTETGRATNQSAGTITGDSSKYNFSSRRADFLSEHRGIKITRNDRRLQCLDRIFREWYQEALAVGQIPQGLPPISQWRWSWNWDGLGTMDENKEATADDTRIKNGTQSYSETFAAYGQDYRHEFKQRAREKKLATSLGLPYPILSANPTGQPAPPANAQQAVLEALAEAGVSEDQAEQVVQALAPTFELLEQRLSEPAPDRRQPESPAAKRLAALTDYEVVRDPETQRAIRLRPIAPSTNGAHP